MDLMRFVPLRGRLVFPFALRLRPALNPPVPTNKKAGSAPARPAKMTAQV